jgi:pimeloyl-ACP methyl ester carboxylesterase
MIQPRDDRATWRDSRLGDAHELDLAQGRLRYFDAGAGATLVFLHGLLVNANLWRKVVERLSDDFRCIVLDLPLGSHTIPMPSADLSPDGLGDLIADTIEHLNLADVTLIGNDTGGALCQILVTKRPAHIGRLVLTSCDYRDNFPPRMFRYLKTAAKVPGALRLLLTPMRFRAPRRLPFAFGWLVKAPIDRKAEDSYLLPALRIAGIRADLKRAAQAIDPRYTNAAADRLREFDGPTLIAWSRDDRFFKPAHAERLSGDLLSARLEWIEGARTFSPEDAPERLAELIRAFAPRGARAS